MDAVAAANCQHKAASRGGWVDRGVGRARSTEEADESWWREGALLGNAHKAMKERRLWQH